MPAKIVLLVAEVFGFWFCFCFLLNLCGAVQTERYQKSLKIEGCLLH